MSTPEFNPINPTPTSTPHASVGFQEFPLYDKDSLISKMPTNMIILLLMTILIGPFVKKISKKILYPLSKIK